jgi:hypothetical protein
VRRLIRCTTVVALASAPLLAHADQITFQNQLSDCVTIKVNKISTESNVVSANTLIELHKPIGECGCLSALATYLSSVTRGGVQQVLQEGLIGLRSGGEKTIILATEPSLASYKDVNVRLACTGPL